ncbi:MAG: hypothetical protein SFV53_02475 [Rickettsiales bacterium]|nr:hypothetical protein [Rickettsiales bacterium]
MPCVDEVNKAATDPDNCPIAIVVVAFAPFLNAVSAAYSPAIPDIAPDNASPPSNVDVVAPRTP